MFWLITNRKVSSMKIRSKVQVRQWLFILLVTTVCGLETGCRSGVGRFNPPQMEKSNLVIPSRWHHSYESAIQEATESGRPILVNFTGSDWCHWCVKLKQDVLSTPEFEAWAKENVVLLELDFPRRSPQSAVLKQQNQDLAKKYGINAYPSVLLIDARGEKLGDRLGYLADSEEWISNASAQISGLSNAAARTANDNPIDRAHFR